MRTKALFIVLAILFSGRAYAASRWITDTFTTASVSASSSLAIDRPIPWNSVDIGKVKVVPSVLSGTTTIGIYSRSTRLDADMAYKSQAFSGNLYDPVQRVASTQYERNESLIATYDDLDAGKELHIKITNASSVAKTYQISISYARTVTSEQLSINDLGAKGDGVTDDSDAINAAFASGSKRILIPCGRYKITEPINATNFTTGLTIEGCADEEGGSWIDADTGGVIFDFTGTQYLTMRNVFVRGDSTSTIGMLFARSSDGTGYAAFNRLENVKIYMATVPAANGGYGTAAIYNFSSEHFRVSNSDLYADTTVVLTYNNIWNISSPFKTFHANVSMTQASITGSALKAHTGYNVWIDTADGVDLRDNYYHKAAGNTHDFPIHIENADVSWGYVHNLQITGYEEIWDGVLETKCLIVGLNIEVSLQHQGDRLIFLDDTNAYPAGPPVQGTVAGIYNGTIKITGHMGSTDTELIGDAGNSDHYGVLNTLIYLFANQDIVPASDFEQTINVGGAFRGNMILSTSTAPSITVANPHDYMVLSPEGISFKTSGQRTNIEGLDDLNVNKSTSAGEGGIITVQNSANDSGAYAGVRLSTSGTAGTYEKVGIFAKSDGSGSARGALILAVDNNANSTNADPADAALTINPDKTITVTQPISGMPSLGIHKQTSAGAGGIITTRNHANDSGAYSGFQLSTSGVDGSYEKGGLFFINDATGSARGNLCLAVDTNANSSNADSADCKLSVTSAGEVAIPNSASPLSNAACTAGAIAWDVSYIYICTASGAWKRAALTGGY